MSLFEGVRLDIRRGNPGIAQSAFQNRGHGKWGGGFKVLPVDVCFNLKKFEWVLYLIVSRLHF
jgi:hypothetical protein